MNRKLRKVLLALFLIILSFIAIDNTVYRVLKQGIVQYYGLEKDAQILCIGHSQTVLGIDAQKLERKIGVRVAKYAVAGANTVDRFWMIKHYLSLNPDVKMVIYGVDARLFDSQGLSSASYTLFLPFVDNPLMSSYLRQYASWQEYYSSKIFKSARFRDQTLNIALRGLFHRAENRKNGRLKVEDFHNYLQQQRKRKIRINDEDLKCFRETLQFLSSRGIRVILIDVPVVDLMNEIDQTNQRKAIDIFATAAETDPNVCFLDYGKDYEHNYALFFDLRHLNEEGKQAITKRLVADLRKIVRKGQDSLPQWVGPQQVRQTVGRTS